MHGPSRQRGLTFIGWMVVIAIAAFFISVTLKLVPIYLENFAVGSSLESMASDGRVRTPGEIRETLSKRFQINDVRHVDRKDIKIVQKNGKYQVRIAYEVRVPFVFNIDFVVMFEDQAEVPAS